MTKVMNAWKRCIISPEDDSRILIEWLSWYRSVSKLVIDSLIAFVGIAGCPITVIENAKVYRYVIRTQIAQWKVSIWSYGVFRIFSQAAYKNISGHAPVIPLL